MAPRHQTAGPAASRDGWRRPWRAGWLGIAGAVVLSAVTAAPGRAAAPPNASYAGGFLTPAAPLVGLRVSAVGNEVVVEGQAIARCVGRGPVDARLTVRAALAPDGSFRGRATRTTRVNVSESRTVSIWVSGQVLDERRAFGSVRLTAVRRRQRAVVRCSSGVQHWEARSIAGVAPGPPAPLGGISYYGPTRQRGRATPFPLALHVSGDRARVDAAVFRVHRRCRGVTSQDVANDVPPTAIRADGSFSVVQRYSRRFSDSIESFTFRFSGRFATLGASGTLRATSILRGLRTRRVIGRCDSGIVTWAAVP